MPCLDEATFTELLLGELSPARAAEVDAHLDACPSCRRLVADGLRAHTPTASRATPLRPVSMATPERPNRLPAAEAVLERGTAVGRYLVLEKLAAGGMGVVYAAYDPELDRRVALKLLRVTALGLDAEEGRQHLLREAQAMARVSHPNVVPVYDVGTFGQQIFLAMELVQAQTLRLWLKESPRSWRQVLTLFTDAGRGLAAAHAAGVVHGDFKPENLLVGTEGRVRITDFGLAHTASDASSAEETPVAGGTPAYMAPELLASGGRADARSDQFAFCVSLYEALYGERPFAGSSVREVSDEARAGRVLPSPKGSPVPPWLRRVVLRGLAVSPTERHASLEALLAALSDDPSVRAKRRLRQMGGLALVLGAVGVTHAVHTADARSCGDTAQVFDGVWDATSRQRIEAAFLATGKPFAATAWLRVRQSLDAYTTAWTTERTAACEATRVRHEQSEEVLAQRLRCLDGRLAEVSALARLFTQADAEVVEQAARAAKGLPPVADCAEVAAPSAGPLPSEPAARERAEALRRTLVQARVLKAAGKYTQGVALVEPVATAAKASGHRYVTADAFLLLGELRDKAGDWQGAESALFEALRAAESGRNDEAAARAWTLLVSVTGEKLERYDLAHRWHERAEVAIERLGGNEVLRARLLTYAATTLYAEGRYAEAAEQQEAALARLEKAFGPDSLEAADVRQDLGSARLAQGRVDEGLGHLKRAVELRREALGEEHPDVARARLALAEAHWQERDLPEAERLSRGALESLERSLGPEHPGVGDALNLLALALQSQKRLDEALSLFERALRIVEKTEGPDSSGAASLEHNIAGVLSQQGRLDEALARFQDVLVRKEKKLGPSHPHLVPVLRYLGNTLRKQGKHREALPHFERAVAIQTAQPDDALSGWTGAHLDLGRALLEAKQPRDARVPLEKVLAGWERAKPTPVERVNTRLFLARALWDAKEDRARALRLAHEARALALEAGDAGARVLESVDAWLAARP
ncbi:tetratricopeptide repeat protein [Archangium sp.]|jgi:tetratricopeptide (TPR) repeat protein|uniref:tetratricopeptide repeat protein n=1 Tax=Archangium sp. TaxID=1872627 RepID=UPI002EDA52EB